LADDDEQIIRWSSIFKSLKLDFYFFPIQASLEHTSFPPMDMLEPDDFPLRFSTSAWSVVDTPSGLTFLPIQASSSQAISPDTAIDDRVLPRFSSVC